MALPHRVVQLDIDSICMKIGDAGAENTWIETGNRERTGKLCTIHSLLHIFHTSLEDFPLDGAKNM